MSTAGSIRSREYDFGKHTRHYLTLELNGFKTKEEIKNNYRELYGYLKKKNIKIVFEKVFGSLSFKNSITGIREYLAETMKLELGPLSYIEGNPVYDVPVSSVAIYGISMNPEPVHFDYIYDNNNKIGTFYSLSGIEYLYLCGLKCCDNSQKATIEEYRSLFRQVQGYMNERNFLPDSIVRTWIYLDNIYENYSNFNSARREFFANNNVDYSGKSNVLPASTCIGGRSSQSSTAVIDFFCIGKNGDCPKIDRMYNRFQNEAEGKEYRFAPTFARAKSIEYENYCEVQISGTASINESGDTVFVDDPYNQIKKTFLNVKALLEQKDMDFGDVCVSTCFFKKKEYYFIFKEVLNELKICEPFSTLVISDVCRSDLLFEFDGIALKRKTPV
ncbi:MAG TPA: Rid family hydrolase [Ruminiclostridium sp.]|nr:Rid family hydrolase [Ruminiclostridium sp.]